MDELPPDCILAVLTFVGTGDPVNVHPAANTHLIAGEVLDTARQVSRTFHNTTLQVSVQVRVLNALAEADSYSEQPPCSIFDLATRGVQAPCSRFCGTNELVFLHSKLMSNSLAPKVQQLDFGPLRHVGNFSSVYVLARCCMAIESCVNRVQSILKLCPLLKVVTICGSPLTVSDILSPWTLALRASSYRSASCEL